MGTPTCLLCLTPNEKLIQKFEAYSYYQCNKCKVLSLHPVPTDEVLKELYGSHHYYQDENLKSGYDNYEALQPGLVETNFRRIRGSTVLFRDKNARILEIGCGTGSFASSLKKLGFENYEGLDINPYAIQKLKENGFRGQNCRLDQLPTGEPYDVIAFFDVIEHIASPKPFLEQLRVHLSKKGEVVFTTPSTKSLVCWLSAHKWVSYIVPDHVILYNPKAMTQLLESCGFRVRRLTYDLQTVPINFVVHRLSQIMRPLAAFHKLLKWIERGKNHSVAVPNGNMLVYAIKK